MLEAATSTALNKAGEDTDKSDTPLSDVVEERGDDTVQQETAESLLSDPPIVIDGDTIRYTKDVAKWLRLGDNKYKAFFVRRMRQLKAGDTSRILAKRLVGCSTPIFETYLEQKSGYRILWTIDGNNGLLVWYIAKHKDVSRLARLIDDAASRSQRQLVSIADLPELRSQVVGMNANAAEASSRRVLLDPAGNTPLKLYELRFDEMDEIETKSWKPRLYLTDEERDIIETSGTVLVLGRSGTGKTV